MIIVVKAKSFRDIQNRLFTDIRNVFSPRVSLQDFQLECGNCGVISRVRSTYGLARNTVGFYKKALTAYIGCPRCNTVNGIV